MNAYQAVAFFIIIVQINASDSEYFNTTIFGDFFADSCQQRVHELKVPSSVKKCIDSVFVYFSCDGKEQSGFLYRDFIVRNNMSVEEICSPTNVVFIENDQFSIKRQNKELLIETFQGYSWKKLAQFFARFVDDVNDAVYMVVIVVTNVLYLSLVYYRSAQKKYSNNYLNVVPKEVFAGNKNDKIVKGCSCGTKGKRCGSGSTCTCSSTGVKCTKVCHNGNKAFVCCNPKNKKKILSLV